MARLISLLVCLSLFIALGATVSACGDDDDDIQDELDEANEEIEDAADDIEEDVEDVADELEEELNQDGDLDQLGDELDDLGDASEEELEEAGDGLIERCDNLREDAQDEEPDVQADVNEFCDELETAVNEGDIERIPELAERFDAVAATLEEEENDE